MREAALALVLAATIGALYLRPLGLRDWQIAGAGGVIAWAIGPLGFEGGLETLRDNWNIGAFFLGLMLLAATADGAGLYRRAGALLGCARTPRRLLAASVIAGTVLTAMLSNDATPLVLTPAVMLAATALGAESSGPLFAIPFTANAASLVLPISNPVNLLFYDRLDMGFARYSSEVLPAAVAGGASLAVVLVVRGARQRIAVGSNAAGPALRSDPWFEAVAASGFAGLAAAYVAGAIIGVPLGLITLSFGGALAFLGLFGHGARLKTIRSHVAPGLFVFIAGLLLLVDSLAVGGALDPTADVLSALADSPVPVAVTCAAVLAAVLSNVLNNWPAALLISASVAVTPGQPPALAAGALIGCTVGANFTAFGSLSTFFWLTLVRAQGGQVTAAAYARAAFVPTALAMAAACASASVAIAL